MNELLDEIYELSIQPQRYERFTEQLDRVLQEPEGEADRAYVEDALKDHFQRAYKILDRISRVGHLGDEAAQFVAKDADSPVVAINKDGLISAISDPAQSLLQTDEGDSIQSTLHAESVRGFEELMSAHLEGEHLAPLIVLTKRNAPLILLMRPVSTQNDFLVHLCGAEWTDRVDQQLGQVYRITPRETAVIKSLYQGNSVREIAELEHRSVETIRKQLKSVLSKTETANQSALMRLISSFMFSQTLTSQRKWAHSVCMNYLLELENGRRLAYYDSAPNASSDRPVILVAHGMIYDPELPEPIHDLLTQRLNYRIIGISRAYYGDSSPPREDINAFEQSLADTVAVLSAIGIESVSVIAHKSGGEHALYWANQRPDLIQRIHVVSGIAPIQSSEDFADMPAGVRTVARTARYFPSLLPLLLRASLVMIHHGDFARLAHIGYQDSVSDMSYIDDAAVAKRLTRGYRFAAHSGTKAYTYEGSILAQAVPGEYTSVSCPVHILHGGQDGVFSVPQIQQYAEKLSAFANGAGHKVSVDVIDGAGHLILYSHAEAVAQWLNTLLVND